jgi:hypothetical protein
MTKAMTNADDAAAPTSERTLDLDALERASGGLSFTGLLGQVGLGVHAGPVGVGVGAGVSPAGPNEGGAAYGHVEVGAGEPGWGLTGGATVGAVFSTDGHSFDDVVTGPSHNLSFGIGQVGWNDNGFYVGVGPSGIGYSRTDTVRLSQEPPAAPHTLENPGDGLDHSNDPPPQLNDWSTAFGPHEGGPPVGTTQDQAAPSPADPGGPTQHFDDGSSLTTFDDGSTLAHGTDGSYTASPATDDNAPAAHDSSYDAGPSPTQHFDDGSSLTTFDDGSTLASGSDGSYSSSPATDEGYASGSGSDYGAADYGGADYAGGDFSGGDYGGDSGSFEA